ncbi:MAG: OmpA family protein [Candidatus Syntrophosphaera sp.]|nr:OmpA family protein [Candidatus Syntrophosphaera sp.]
MPALFAFESTLTLQGGVAIPTDDVDGENVWKGAWGLSWDAWLTKYLALGINPYFNNLLVMDGADMDSYSSSIEGVDVYLKLRPTNFLTLNFKDVAIINRVSPFAALGVGYAHHGSKSVQGLPELDRSKYMYVLPNVAAGISLLTKWNTTLDLGVKYDYTNTDRIDFKNTGYWQDGYITPYIGLGLHFGGRKAALQPVILATAAFGDFSTTQGTPSAAQSYTLAGTDLTGDINVIAPEGYELSLDGGSTWAKTATWKQGSDLPILVRLTGEEAGAFNGNIVNSSLGAVTLNLPVFGIVQEYIAPQPEITSVGTFTRFSTEEGSPSAAQSVRISGKDLAGMISVSAPEGYEISADGGQTWVKTATLRSDFDGTVWARLTGTQPGDYEGHVIFSSAGAPDLRLPVSGRVNEKMPEPVKEIDPGLIQTVVHFETYLYEISPSDKLLLDALAAGLKEFPGVKLLVRGHTDNSGNDRINIPLGENRAKAVKEYLVSKGVEADRLETKGYAATVPMDTNETVEGRANNRRTDFAASN